MSSLLRKVRSLGSPSSKTKAPEPPAKSKLEQEEKEPQPMSMDDFELLCVVGKGSFGKVLQVRHKTTKEIFAVKILKKKQLIARNQVEHTKTERRVMQSIRHPFIVRLHGAFQTENKLYMVMDYVNGGELFFHLKREGRFSEERVSMYVAELVLAIEHLHKHDVVYRDLKPENILLHGDGHLTITDFGLSKQFKETTDTTHTFCGTPEYLAPEVLQGGGHGTAVDWWSLGTLMYEMLTGLPPFYSQNVNVMYERILQGELKFPPYLSSEARSLLTGLLQRDPALRLGGGVSDGEEIKSHPFFDWINFNKLLKKEVVPPWKPDVTDIMDRRNIDPAFTQLAAVDSLPDEADLARTAEQAAFENFTYVARQFSPPAANH
eukprot:TRINITY_DN15541_c0_g1_i1.p1 TRINITY_DN15541_c0_g1~~TRINITY_DN15541_c0_g1_i1.p1  ORF type:complete len:377 (+),score=64.45 TRINITY_DN15541_c0_g1_i1:36-1166(+)